MDIASLLGVQTSLLEMHYMCEKMGNLGEEMVRF